MHIRTCFPGRLIICVGLLLCASTAWPQSQPYPNRPVHLIVPFPPGGAVDPLARMFSQKLDEVWKQPVLIENKPGAGTIIGTDALAKSPPDGYTVMLGAASFTVNAAMNSKLPYDPVKDIAPISLVFKVPQMLVVNPQVPVNSVKELIDYLKSHPGKLNYASSGSGAAAHLAGELFKSMTKTDMVHIPFKGAGPAITDVLAGRSQMIFATALSVKAYIDANRLRPLGVTTLKRMDTMPNLPTIAESGVPGFEASTWHGLVAVAGTPRAVTTRLNAEVNAILKDSQVSKFLESQGAIIEGGTAEKFAEHIKAEIPKWAKVIKDSGARAD